MILDSIDEHLYHDIGGEIQELAKKEGRHHCFGHSHEQFTKKTNGTLFINPEA